MSPEAVPVRRGGDAAYLCWIASQLEWNGLLPRGATASLWRHWLLASTEQYVQEEVRFSTTVPPLGGRLPKLRRWWPEVIEVIASSEHVRCTWIEVVMYWLEFRTDYDVVASRLRKLVSEVVPAVAVVPNRSQKLECCVELTLQIEGQMRAHRRAWSPDHREACFRAARALGLGRLLLTDSAFDRTVLRRLSERDGASTSTAGPRRTQRRAKRSSTIR